MHGASVRFCRAVTGGSAECRVCPQCERCPSNHPTISFQWSHATNQGKCVQIHDFAVFDRDVIIHTHQHTLALPSRTHHNTRNASANTQPTQSRGRQAGRQAGRKEKGRYQSTSSRVCLLASASIDSSAHTRTCEKWSAAHSTRRRAQRTYAGCFWSHAAAAAAADGDPESAKHDGASESEGGQGRASAIGYLLCRPALLHPPQHLHQCSRQH
jgi:hypothetical protein